MTDPNDWDAPPSPLRNQLWDLQQAVLQYEMAQAAYRQGHSSSIAVQLRGRTAAMHAERLARMIRREIREEDGR